MLNATQIAQVQELAAAVEAHDGVAPFNEQTLLSLTSPDARHMLTSVDEQLIAFASVVDHSAELAVHPDYRNQGWGSAMLAALKHQVGSALNVWAHGNSAAAQKLAQKAGLAPVRELLLMAADLPQVPASPKLPTPPAGYRIEQFKPGQDEQAWVRLNQEAFASHAEQGRLTVADLQQRMAQPWFDATAFFMLWHGDELAGFIWLKPEAGETEIYVVAVAPSHQGNGLGGYLTSVGLAAAAARAGEDQWSDSRVILYTDGHNVAARRAYERAGFGVARLDVQYRLNETSHH